MFFLLAYKKTHTYIRFLERNLQAICTCSRSLAAGGQKNGALPLRALRKPQELWPHSHSERWTEAIFTPYLQEQSTAPDTMWGLSKYLQNGDMAGKTCKDFFKCEKKN